MRKLTNVFPILAIAIMLFMFGCEQVSSPNHETGTDIETSNIAGANNHTGTIVYVDANATGADDGSSTTNAYDTIQEGVDDAGPGDVVELLSDFTLSSQVTISDPLTLDGNGNTVFSPFSETDNDNNSAIGIIGTSDITVSDLTIDGTSGTNLHGINVYESTGVLVSDVSLIDNANTGLVVNGSEVTAHNISTAGNGWHGMNVGQGTNVTDPAILSVTGTSAHAEGAVPDIFVDDISQEVTVNDVNDQYVSIIIDFSGGEAEVYTHYKSLSKDDCMKGGYADFGFKNQGQCIQFVNTGKK